MQNKGAFQWASVGRDIDPWQSLGAVIRRHFDATVCAHACLAFQGCDPLKLMHNGEEFARKAVQEWQTRGRPWVDILKKKKKKGMRIGSYYDGSSSLLTNMIACCALPRRLHYSGRVRLRGITTWRPELQLASAVHEGILGSNMRMSPSRPMKTVALRQGKKEKCVFRRQSVVEKATVRIHSNHPNQILLYQK